MPAGYLLPAAISGQVVLPRGGSLLMAAATAISDDYYRVGALAGLAPHLPADQLARDRRNIVQRHISLYDRCC